MAPEGVSILDQLFQTEPWLPLANGANVTSHSQINMLQSRESSFKHFSSYPSSTVQQVAFGEECAHSPSNASLTKTNARTVLCCN